MSGTFTPRLDVLPHSQKRLWPELGKAPDLGFTLYGGTAIALRLGHRVSVDFDFFSEKPIDRHALKAAFPFMAQSTTLQQVFERGLEPGHGFDQRGSGRCEHAKLESVVQIGVADLVHFFIPANIF